MVLEYRPQWQVPGGDAGVTVLHGRGTTGTPAGTAAQDLADRARAFLAGIAGSMPDDVQLTFPGEVLDRDTATGVLTAVHAINPPAAVSGSQVGGYAAPVGARVHWHTSAIVSGRRLQGRTFIVPLVSGAFASDGTLVEATRDALKAVAETYIDSGVNAWVEASVWSPTHGIQADITSVTVPDQAAVLRSRRD